MKVYTKTGDGGETSILGGKRMPKHHIRITSYGEVDELNTWIGVIRDHADTEEFAAFLIEIQTNLFTIGSQLASDPEKSNIKIPQIEEVDISALETAIDKMEETLPPMKNFVLPGGHPRVSNCHIARTVCRRAERATSHLAANEQVDKIILRYLNRLSDYLFVLSRSITQQESAVEIPWKPRG